jgi:hypothetical protein
MKTYLIIEEENYEYSIVIKAFSDKQKAIEFIREVANKRNAELEKDYPWSKNIFKISEDGEMWETSIQRYKIQEIEVE